MQPRSGAASPSRFAKGLQRERIRVPDAGGSRRNNCESYLMFEPALVSRSAGRPHGIQM